MSTSQGIGTKPHAGQMATIAAATTVAPAGAALSDPDRRTSKRSSPAKAPKWDEVEQRNDSSTCLLDALLRQPQTLVTPMLEARFAESLRAAWVSQVLLPAGEGLAESLHIGPAHRVLARRILLQGRRSGTCYLVGESRIVLDRLPRLMAKGLLETSLPIGTLLARSGLVTMRDRVEYSSERAGELLARRLRTPHGALVPTRRYRISGQRPLMVVQEWFGPALLEPTASFPGPNREDLRLATSCAEPA